MEQGILRKEEQGRYKDGDVPEGYQYNVRWRRGREGINDNGTGSFSSVIQLSSSITTTTYVRQSGRESGMLRPDHLNTTQQSDV